jgi:D-amino peptidase
MLVKKIYIWTDIEGVVGAIEWDNFCDESPLVIERRNRVRQQLTDEIVAACEGALEAGVEYILVKDSHGCGDNIFYEDLPPEADFIIGCKHLPHPWADLDVGGYDAAVIIGAHPCEGTEKGILPHTTSKINGSIMGDAGMLVKVAASLGIPVVFACGDFQAMEQLKEVDQAISTLSVKEAYGPYSAKMRSPQKACQMIEEGVKSAIENYNLSNFKKAEPPYTVSFPNTEEVSGDNLIELITNLLDPDKLQFNTQSLEPLLSQHKQHNKKWWEKNF